MTVNFGVECIINTHNTHMPCSAIIDNATIDNIRVRPLSVRYFISTCPIELPFAGMV